MRTIIFIAWVSFISVVAVAGAPFVNLDFESANTNASQIEERFVMRGAAAGYYIFGSGLAADLLPGWTVIEDGHATNVVAIGNGYYNWPTPLSIPCYASLGVQGSYFSFRGGSSSDGKYTLFFDCTRTAGGFRPVGVAQTGEVPASAKLLLITGGGVSITLNDQFALPVLQIDLIKLGGVFRRVADVSARAGQTVTLGIAPADDLGGVVDGLEFLGSDPLRLDPRFMQLTTNGFNFAWIGELATKYQVESTTNVTAGWQSIGPPVSSTNYVNYFTDTTATNQVSGERFYRLRTVP